MPIANLQREIQSFIAAFFHLAIQILRTIVAINIGQKAGTEPNIPAGARIAGYQIRIVAFIARRISPARALVSTVMGGSDSPGLSSINGRWARDAM